MNPLYTPDSLVGAWELLCYVFTALGVLISFVTTLRG